MSIESNKAVVRRVFEEAMNQRKLAIIDEVIGPDYVNRSMPAPAPGPAGLRVVLQGFIEGFPDLQIRLHDVIGEGDLVTTRGEFTGTHRGAFMGVPPTGKKVTVGYIDLWRFQDGKAVENWVQMDLLGLMQQLGVVPAR
jgi:predicted ester cyclase